MSEEQIIKRTIDFVKETLKDAEGGHDWWHIQRVLNTATNLAIEESADLFTVKMASLLHDIADSKFHHGNEEIGPEIARKFMSELGVIDDILENIILIIENVSFKGGKTKSLINTIEFKVVQDADRLDALGAIGIARAFNYGGYKNRALYDPTIKPNLDMTKEEYKSSTAPTINHFYEKLLLLKDRMHTEAGKREAVIRHGFMIEYLEQFYKEFNGELN